MRGRVQKVNNVDDRVNVVIENILDGVKSPKVHTFAAMAVNDWCGDEWCVAPKNWEGEIGAVHDMIRSNIRYTLDPYPYDTYRSCDRTLELAIGDCDDMSALTGAVLQVIGYPVKLKVIRMTGNDDFHHIYAVAGLPPEQASKWIAVDTAEANRPGVEPWGIVESKLYDVEL